MKNGLRSHRGFVSVMLGALVMGLVSIAPPASAGRKPPKPPPEPTTTTSKVQFSSATYTRSEAGGLAVVSIKRTSKKGTASVAFTTTDNTATAGADYGPWNGTSHTGLVSFASGQTVKTLNIPIYQDALFEGPELVNLTLGPEVTNLQLGGPAQAELTIFDDEVATLSVADVAPVTEGAAAEYTVSVATAAARVAPVQLNWAVVYGGATAGDFVAPVSGQVAVPTNASSATFLVLTAPDDIDEPSPEAFTVVLSDVSGGATIADGTATGGIVDDDDAPLVTLGDAARAGEGSDLSFSVNLSAQSAFDVTAGLELWTPGAQYPAVAYAEAEDVVPPASLNVTIPAGATSAPFVVGTVDDALYEGDESFGVHLVGATNAVLPPDDLGGASQADRWAYGTIGDSELPAVCVFDAFEPNDAPLLLTTPLAAGTYPSLTLCPDEGGHPMWVGADWYPIDVNAGDTIEVTVDFLHAEGNIFIGIADFTNPDEPGDLGFSDGTGNQEHVVAVAPYTRRYHLLVGLDIDAGTIPGNAYTLTLTVTPAPVT